MKNFSLTKLLLSAVMLIFASQIKADKVTPDFTFGYFGCVITSEENAEVAIYYNNMADFDFYGKTHFPYIIDDENDIEKELVRCDEKKVTFPNKVQWNNKTYTVTSLYPYTYTVPEIDYDGTTYFRTKNVVGITEVELPATLKQMPNENPLKYYCDLYRISINRDNEYFKTENGCLYSSDGTILYAVPVIPDKLEDIILFKGNEQIKKICKDAIYESYIRTIDFSQSKNIEPLKASFFNKFLALLTWHDCKLYLPPKVIFDINNFNCNPGYYYLPSSINNIETGYIPGGEKWLYKSEAHPCYIDTYYDNTECFVIKDGFISVDNGSRLVAYDTNKIPYSFAGDEYYIFYNLPENINFPEGIETIVTNLFSDRTMPEAVNFTNYTLPSTLRVIEDYAFEGYKGSENYIETLPSVGKPHYNYHYSHNGTIHSRDTGGNEIKNMLPERLEILGKGCFMRSMLKEITVPNVKYIPELAFAGCKQLEKITFGKGVEQIELSALFVGVPIPDTDEIRLTPETCVIECLSTTPPQLLSTDFDTDQTFNNTVIVPDEAFEAYKEAWGDKFPNIYTVSGVNTVSADNTTDGEEIFYNLNGQRVDGQRDALAPGLYICRKADKSTKVIIR